VENYADELAVKRIFPTATERWKQGEAPRCTIQTSKGVELGSAMNEAGRSYPDTIRAAWADAVRKLNLSVKNPDTGEAR